ncbi:MAG: PilT/PilU family type 4a pilus ATPase [Erysipelotrichaceae bacterium]|nr:PilT/PilU family type 4a pilus ATPase [Erysipelotrichaceae bacterium]
MNIEEIITNAVKADAADIFLIAGLPLTYKINGSQNRIGDMLYPEDVEKLVREIYTIANRDTVNIDKGLDDDFSFAKGGLGRFRVNAFRQRGSLAAVIRLIKFGIPDPVEMNIPESVLSLADNKKGLVLVTGSAGSGKSTTLACMIDRINKNRECHIITMEDPIEFIHRHEKSIVTQREVYIDTPGYLESLRSALRESPDVILLGEMRDYETISAAITAAETGTLLISTLHTSSAINTISRIIDVYPASQQHQVKIQLAQILKAIVSQQLVTGVNGEQIPAFEVLKNNTAIQTMIREDNLHQITGVMSRSAAEGMFTMDTYLYNLYKQGKISKEELLVSCVNHEKMLERV